MLQCSSAFISELSTKANLAFDPKIEGDLDFDKLEIDSKVTKVEGKESTWQVVIKVIFDAAAAENAAYSFTVEVVGFFTCKSVPNDDQERFVGIQACSILYGMARDALLDSMTKGPWNSIFLPLASFYTPKEASTSDEQAAI
jgi:preprotein translocase subunit SecB